MKLISILPIFAASGSWALDCSQIPASQIYAGNQIFIPGPSKELQPLPANFNCVYKITVPVNATSGLYAHVVLRNGLKGVNDYIIVTDMTGLRTIHNNRTGMRNFDLEYKVIPGAQMSIQVTTKTNIGPTIQMKTGSEMNYYRLSAAMSDGSGVFSSVTMVGNEPIAMSYPLNIDNLNIYSNIYIIEGTLTNQTSIYKMTNKEVATSTNAITIVAFDDGFYPLVFNTLSEMESLAMLLSIAAPRFAPYQFGIDLLPTPDVVWTVEIVNFDGTGITMTDCMVMSETCGAYVLDGPPNNSSKVLLDLSSAKMPHRFDLKYITVMIKNCDLLFEVVQHWL
ncbi:hypothetical protein GCK72_021512 [Caenorhabditis remanei]|uniref:CUB-like domain-containing protein n=1 Tax=Caenorhabditis remanei TaxID=31234 RepID=A0A6A5GIC9_CAERE|nr:hypothetical protein GCK72_021512 [Caenorhabditis remanei]KAF1754947.1 hypothetical protein GCK72_021512 [Caenorhabditis remanei]